MKGRKEVREKSQLIKTREESGIWRSIGEIRMKKNDINIELMQGERNKVKSSESQGDEKMQKMEIKGQLLKFTNYEINRKFMYGESKMKVGNEFKRL